MKRSLTVVAVALGLLTAIPHQASAQVEEVELDRVVAIVGDSVIVLSQILQRESELRAGGAPVPTLEGPREEFLRSLVDDLVSTQILLQAAAQDTLLSVDEDQVDESVQQQIASSQNGFGGQEQMEAALLAEGLTLQTYRGMIREQIRQGQLVELYVRRHSSQAPVEVTDAELRKFFEEQRGSIQQRPATVTFRQVVLTVQASDSAKSVAQATADSILEQINAGEDFSELAMAHSQDPGSAQVGGDLGWFRRGNLAQEFEDAAFNLLESEVSEVIETAFGFHIIKVDRVRFAERKARHILISAPVLEADVARTRVLAEELRERANTEGLQAFSSEYHDEMVPDSATIGMAQLEQVFSAGYRQAVEAAESGSIIGPVEFDVRGTPRLALIHILHQREAGAYVFEDLQDQIRQQVLQQKKVERLVSDLRERIFVELKLNP